MSFASLRYSKEPFPAYRFRPGVNPHPTASPHGHSRNTAKKSSPPACGSALMSPGKWLQCRDYLYGCDLYNHAYWWEAHEAWEDLWRATGGAEPLAAFLKGLIQAGACALKTELGNRVGARRLLRRSVSHLCVVLDQMTGPTFMGLDVAHWLNDLRSYYGRVLEAPAPRHDPGAFPFIRLTPDNTKEAR